MILGLSPWLLEYRLLIGKGDRPGNAEWTGVPLGALLEGAGMEEDACEIVLEGADQGTPDVKPIPPGPISYARSLPRDKAIQREVVIAYQMNGP